MDPLNRERTQRPSTQLGRVVNDLTAEKPWRVWKLSNFHGNICNGCEGAVLAKEPLLPPDLGAIQ